MGTLLCWHAYDVMFMGCDSHFGTQKNYATTTPLDKGHVPEILWKLSVTYLFEDTDFPIGGLYSLDFTIILLFRFRCKTKGTHDAKNN